VAFAFFFPSAFALFFLDLSASNESHSFLGETIRAFPPPEETTDPNPESKSSTLTRVLLAGFW